MPGGFAAGHFGAGAVIGSFGFVEAVRGGFEAGRRAAAHAGHDTPASELPLPDLRARSAMPIEPVWEVAPQRAAARRSSISRTTSPPRTSQLAHREGYQSVEHLKRYTTLGMGTDQGKTSNINALAIMAGLRGVDIPAAGTTTFRPPYSPVAIGALAGPQHRPSFPPDPPLAAA